MSFPSALRAVLLLRASRDTFEPVVRCGTALRGKTRWLGPGYYGQNILLLGAHRTFLERRSRKVWRVSAAAAAVSLVRQLLESLLSRLNASRWGGQRDGPLVARFGTPLGARRLRAPLRARRFRVPLRARGALDDRLALGFRNFVPRA